MIKITAKEHELLKALEEDFNTTEGDGVVSGNISSDTFDMKASRGVISSLLKKGIIEIPVVDNLGGRTVWGTKEEDLFVSYIVVKDKYGSNYKLRNLEVCYE